MQKGDAVSGKWKADVYAANSKGQAVWAQELIEKIDLRGDESILDVGCGDGKITNSLSQITSGEVVGVDFSAEMIAYAKETFETPVFMQMDAQKLEFNERFDIVFSNAALHWISDHQGALQGIYKALKKGGRIILQMGGQGNIAQIRYIIETKVIPRYPAYFEGFRAPYTFCSAEYYEKLLQEVGFTNFSARLIPKDMIHENTDAFRGWIETTWFPYIDRVPSAMQEDFIQECVEAYIKAYPLDEKGRVHVAAVRLEVKAQKE
jgi:trans-aconitate 2-methyltransferase